MEAALQRIFACLDRGVSEDAQVSSSLDDLRRACASYAALKSPAAIDKSSAKRLLSHVLRPAASGGGGGGGSARRLANRLACMALICVTELERDAAPSLRTPACVSQLIEAIEELEECEGGGGEAPRDAPDASNTAAASGACTASAIAPGLTDSDLRLIALSLALGSALCPARTTGKPPGAGRALVAAAARPRLLRALVRAALAQAAPAPADPRGDVIGTDLLRLITAALQIAPLHEAVEARSLDALFADLLALRLHEHQPLAHRAAAVAAAWSLYRNEDALPPEVASNAGILRGFAACMCVDGTGQVTTGLALSLLSLALDSGPAGAQSSLESAGPALDACCEPNTLKELLRLAASGGGGGGAACNASAGGAPLVRADLYAAIILSKIACCEMQARRPSSIAASPAAAAAVVAGLRACLAMQVEDSRSRADFLGGISAFVALSPAPGGAAWASALARLGALPLLRRSLALLAGPRAAGQGGGAAQDTPPEAREASPTATTAMALYAVACAATPPAQGRASAVERPPAEEIEARRAREEALAELLTTGDELRLLAAMQPSWRRQLAEEPGVLLQLSATASAPGGRVSAELACRGMEGLALLAAALVPAEALPSALRSGAYGAVAGAPGEPPDDAAIALGVTRLGRERYPGLCMELLGRLTTDAGVRVAQQAAEALCALGGTRAGPQQPSQEGSQPMRELTRAGVQRASPSGAAPAATEGGAGRQAPAGRLRRACAVCGKTARDGAELRRCAGCGRVTGTRYCSQECCRTDWVVRGHRAVCEAARRP
ncbi:hypothetical protein MNEG_14480 [Monoraphidium neglectum]|uniref:MYND-type domain-containing protein n=1 Tax=Monoraphidium neglectum TaxID=145388 RepID=A0A0D2KCA0_9CHLO|nr:hypothetical protein MNEG_14480 [Monoraphidium neglectum]KIY93483.1 hypothetical protein MNEG_14480 [Monoraphidium neglectum]|eukprot:XP_013892503.1 hypothetical protein MNEG_14480 [Monoraphidium neglectum]